MSAQSMTRQVSGLHVGPIGILLLGAAVLIAVLGVAGAGSLTRDAGANVQAPAPAFNAVEFRAGEKAPLGAQSFDYAQFRAGEKQAIGGQGFDATGFRAEEKVPVAIPGFDAAAFRAGEKSLR